MTKKITDAGRRRLLCGCAALGLSALVGCSREGGDAKRATGPQEIAAGSSCSLDGMLLADYPGPKGQIRYKGDAELHWFCDGTELLATLLRPEQVRAVEGAWVQDMGKADWDKPVGHWTDARQAVYVLGSKRHGSMGPTAASFADQGAAQAFSQKWGGRVITFAQLKPEDVDLTGGALHDTRM